MDSAEPSDPTVRVEKWGNSLAIRLPSAVVEVLSLKEGDQVELTAAQGGSLTVARKPAQQELVDRLRHYEAMISADIQFDREKANTR